MARVIKYPEDTHECIIARGTDTPTPHYYLRCWSEKVAAGQTLYETHYVSVSPPVPRGQVDQAIDERNIRMHAP